jgi:hypothetical protein
VFDLTKFLLISPRQTNPASTLSNKREETIRIEFSTTVFHCGLSKKIVAKKNVRGNPDLLAPALYDIGIWQFREMPRIFYTKSIIKF